MKLNYRDRIVLTVLIVILVWVAGVMLFIKPGIEKLQDAQTALDDAIATRSDLQDRVDADADLPERIVEAYKQVTEMTKDFYDAKATEQASQMVDDLLDADELTNLNMTITDYQPYVLNPYVYMTVQPTIAIDEEIANYEQQKPVSADDALVSKDGTEETEGAETESAKKGEPVPAPAEIGCYKLSFDFEGTIDDMEKFCEKLQTSNDQKTMVVESLSYEFQQIKTKTDDGKVAMSSEYSDTDIKGTMELTMMVIGKLPDPKTLG
ncbi:hypothetical protein [Ruminococcus sp.]|uniref:hypothetical protein n=1 Tax=Ruminococcus sp. TaxID=41978 RepID=UPI0025CBA4EC|nr:hypothetical protein [Ruminococcus sp.]MBQ8965755.1 hypothetical protein [Ruminococcus sp.]